MNTSRKYIWNVHGRPHNSAYSKTYFVWNAIKQRCRNKNCSLYKHYGGRGIRICERWNTFSNFLSDMGEKPHKMTIERINNNGNYEPSNCKWATMKEQARNRRGNTNITFMGKTMCLQAWAEKFKIPISRLVARIKYEWSIEKALTSPLHHPGPPSNRK